MENIRMESMEDYDDLATHGQYARALKAGLSETEAFDIVVKRSRDNSRTPMQWNQSRNAGFSDADKTWIKVNKNYTAINAEQEENDKNSVLNFYRELIRLRQDSPYSHILVHGKFVPYDAENDNVIAYERVSDDLGILTFHNFQDQNAEITIPEGYAEKIAGNYTGRCPENNRYCLRPYECIAFYKDR